MKALRVSLYLMGATLAVVMAFAGALWVLSGAGTSLSTSLGQLARWLPAEQTLDAKEVTGSLRSGGHIGWLRWQRGELSVEVRDLSIAWSPRQLLDGELQLGKVHAQHVRIEDHRLPEPATAPTDLRLPLKVDLAFTVDTVEWIGATSLQATKLSGHYVFDSYSHSVYEGQVHISSGDYRLNAKLQALPPMALLAQLDGTVQTILPSRQKPLAVQAHVTVTGALAGQDAALALLAELMPERSTKPDAQRAMQGRVTARIQPWLAQPITQAKANWQGLDLAALWPQAPQTRLEGEATVTPQAPGWQAAVRMSNALSGPWDQQRVPVERLDARVGYANGQWNIQSLQANAAGGTLQAQGHLSPAASPETSPPSSGATPPAQWQGSATMQGINPAALDSRLGATVLDGKLSAHQTSAGIAFDAQLQTANGKAGRRQLTTASQRVIDGLRLKTTHAQGLWATPTLKLSTLTVQTDDAQLQGQFTLDTRTLATEGQLTLALPGAQATLEGSAASTKGQGAWNLHVADVAQAERWISRFPGVRAPLGATAIQGLADFTGRWQGGWKNQGRALHIDAQLRAPRLALHAQGQAPEQTRQVAQVWQLRDGQADVSGTLSDLTLSTRGTLETTTQGLALQAQAQGGLLSNGVWQGRLNTAHLTLQDKLRPDRWTVQLNESVSAQWRQNGSNPTLDVSAGSARLTGPVPGVAMLNWQPAQWSQHTANGKVRTQWRTQGRVADLPLAWLDRIGQSQMANLGLRGDLLFGGQWDASSGETLRLRATLERTAGDLQLQPDTGGTGGTGGLQAGVREARLMIETVGEQVTARLRWDSERAGQAQAEFSTRLQHQNASWTWPSDAALAGTVKVQLPPLGVWSLLAPPGWRLRGTLDANAVLSGTRAAPQWSGTLSAQDLTVRSVVDGIDFSHGSLRAVVAGERLDIQELTVQGAGGASGGLLSVTGSVWWMPTTATDPAPPSSALSHVRMNLIATAKALRVSARADRRLSVSGTVTAVLDKAKLLLRGTLMADQALFILPEDSAPQLGDDVVVRHRDTAQTSAGTRSATNLGAQVTPDLLITLDLGPDFRVRGRGIDTRLAGQLELRSAGGDAAPPSLHGTLRAVNGTYKAYGQNLDIEQGVLRYVGPYDNPALDILAIRPNLQQRVGVQISGTSQSPVVRLYAEPDLPEAEKLAWLVLGRSGASGGAEAAVLQQAALSLLGGKGKGLSSGLTQALGLDELSLRNDGARNIDGTTSATVTLGKRVSRDFYLAYERSLVGTMGTLSIFFDLSRRFAVRAQAGEQSAIDLIFTLPYD